jgi:hypothetical protein
MKSEAELVLDVARRLEEARSCVKMTSERTLEYFIGMAIAHALERLTLSSPFHGCSDESEHESESRVLN